METAIRNVAFGVEHECGLKRTDDKENQIRADIWRNQEALFSAYQDDQIRKKKKEKVY